MKREHKERRGNEGLRERTSREEKRREVERED